MKDHAEAHHRGGIPLLGRSLCPATGFGAVDGNAVSLKQHPAQHVLHLDIALFGGCAIKGGRSGVILVDAVSPEIERRQIALSDRIAGLGS